MRGISIGWLWTALPLPGVSLAKRTPYDHGMSALSLWATEFAIDGRSIGARNGARGIAAEYCLLGHSSIASDIVPTACCSMSLRDHSEAVGDQAGPVVELGADGFDAHFLT